MSRKQLQMNGMEGDDERDEEDSEEEEEDSEVAEEEEEDEPRLKYQRMGGSVPSLLSNDAASCIAVAERMIALGTHDGAVHILDFLGNQVSMFYSVLDFYGFVIEFRVLFYFKVENQLELDRDSYDSQIT